jgi:hypothetical protein
MSTSEYPIPGRPPAEPAVARPRNGLGVTALVLGVASLVAVSSFVLFPLGFLGGIIAVILGIIAIARGSTKGATNPGQATAGIICGALAMIIAVVFAVRVGTWAARNTSVFTRFDHCIAQAGSRSEVADCIARFSRDVRQ